MEDLLGICILLLVAFVGAAFLFRFLNLAVEPLYIMVTGRPLYIHFYPIRSKLTPPQQTLLRRSVPFYSRLSHPRKSYFEHRVASFIKKYPIHGHGGIIINDEMRILIASTYVMLTFGMRHYRINAFDKIIVYPDQYLSTISNQYHKGEFNPVHRAVVFSWRHFEEGVREGSDNLNLGIHEFAHAIHFHGRRGRDASAAIFSDRYRRILAEISHPPNAKRLIDSDYFRIYGYTNQFEFLAVVLEHFFETPHQFRHEFPQLYDNVRRMINFDPDLVAAKK